jgi:hypothetical protein
MPKNTLLRSAAHTVVCRRCQRHARIVLATGERTDIFESKEEGHLFIDVLIAEGKIIKPEETFLRHELDNSPLPEEEPVKEEILSLLVLVNHEESDTGDETFFAPRWLM